MGKKSFLVLVFLIIGITGCHKTSLNGNQKDFVLYAQDTHSIFFRFNGNKIEDESVLRMKNLISQLKKIRNIELVMYGYTDRVGAKDYNYKLAQRRIKAVKTMLIKSGVITANNISIKTKTLDENDPLISKHTVNNNSHSRRVDIYITYPR